MDRNRIPGFARWLAALAVVLAFSVELAAEVGERRREEIDVEAELAELEEAPAPAELPPPAAAEKKAQAPRAERPSRPSVVRELRPEGEAARIRVFEESGSLFSRGVDAHRRGDLELAERRYLEALAIDPNFVEAMVNLARTLAGKGDRDAAEDWLDRARGEQPGYPGVPAARGWIALQNGEPSRAVEHLEEAQRLAPDDVDVLVNLGAALAWHGRLHQARQVLEVAVRREPEDDQVVLNLAVVEDRSGRVADAVHQYRRYLELSAQADPGRAEVIRRLEELGAPAPASPLSVGVGSGPVPIRALGNPKEEENQR